MNTDYRFFSKVCSVLVVSLSLIVLAGWQFDQPLLRELAPGAPGTTPLTALLLIFLGVSLYLANQKRPEINNATDPWLRGLAWVLAGTAVSISLFTLFQYFFSLTPSLEVWFYPTKVQQIQTDFPGRPSPHTAINGIICGLAMMAAITQHPKARKLSIALSLVSVVIPWVVIFGYLTLANPLYALQSNPQTGMSPITAVSFILFTAGLLARRPKEGIVGLLRSDSPGGRVVRRFLPFTVLMTVFFGWIVQVGSNQGLFAPSLAFTISWAIGSLGFILLILQQGFSLHRQFQERNSAAEEKERMLQKLAKEEEKSRTLLESAPDALVIVDELGQIVIVNKQAEILFQYPREELIDKPVEILMPEQFRGNHSHLRQQFFAQPQARPMGIGLELYGRRRNGSEFPAEVSLNVFQTPEETLALATIRDVTEQKLAEETLREFNSKLEARARQITAELRERTEALETSNLELQQFAYIASHDLQTPLRNISGFVQLLQQAYHDKLDEQAHEWINITVENTIRMQTLIRDILAYSRVESPSHPFEFVDLNEVMNEVCATLKSYSEENNAEIHLDELPVVLGNRTQLILLMQNLIGNGIKYNNSNQPQIHIGAQKNAHEWIIAVQDNGIGINPDFFPKILEIFRRLHTQEEYPGNGIGLAICRRVVEKHGGKMWIESEPNRGSTFYFSLPKEGDANGPKS